MKSKTKVEQLVELIKDKFDIYLLPSSFKRLYPGFWQRGNGAWSWSMDSKDFIGSMGSCDSVTELLKHKDTIERYKNEFHIS